MPNERHAPGQERAVHTIETGWFKLRIVHGGWRVPALIGRDDDGWFAVIDGYQHASDEDPWQAEGVSYVHTSGYRISEPEYDALLALKEWARNYDPSHPALWPQRAIDPMSLRPIYPTLRTPTWTR